MLQTLSDFFLIISKDGEKITNKDLTVFYNFIIKKLPQIEQQFPSLILKSLNISSQIYDKKSMDLSEFNNNKDSKKLFNHFQKQIMHLFNNLIDYCYNDGIIKLNNNFEKIIKDKIEDIIKEKNNKNIMNINSSCSYNNYYKKEIMLKKAKKEELRNILILLIINGDINFNIYPHQYINFLNSENKLKNRLSVEQFMKIIKNIIKLYKENKKLINKRTIIKSNNNTGKKINNTERKKVNIYQNNNITDEKRNRTDEKENSSKIKKFDKDIIKRKIPKFYNNNKISEKEINKNRIKQFENEFILENSDNFNGLSNNEHCIKKRSFQNNQLIVKLTPLSDNSIIINDNSDDDENEINDTIKCETPKNINKKQNREINEKIIFSRVILENEKDDRKYSADKKTNSNANKRLTISTIPLKNEDKNNSEDKDNKKKFREYYSSKFSIPKSQKKNFANRNKNNIITNEKKNLKYHQSLVDQNYMNNKIIRRNFVEDKNKQINKSQSILGKDIFEKEFLNFEKIKISNNKINNYDDNKKIKEEEKKHDTIFNDKFNVVSKIKTDKNNKQYKELYLYKNLEVYQHLVLFNEDKEKEEKEEEDFGCMIS